MKKVGLFSVPDDDLGDGVRQAVALFNAGQHEQGLAQLETLYQSRPHHFGVLFCLAQMYEALGRIQLALDVYQRAEKVNPGQSIANSRATILQLCIDPNTRLTRQRKASRPSGDVIAMSSLGCIGRFGNQLLQYAFLKCYAKEHKLAACTPDWIGRYLFELDDHAFNPQLSTVREDAPFCTLLDSGALVNKDLWGWCIHHTSFMRTYKQYIHSLFTPRPVFTRAFDQMFAALKAKGDTLVAIHLRGGDFKNYQQHSMFWVAPHLWYVEWLSAHWRTLANPVLYIATDDPENERLPEFAEYDPIYARALENPLPAAAFFLDFQILRNADFLAVSNSTFSFMASMLNTRFRQCFRPDPSRASLVPYDPWDAPVHVRKARERKAANDPPDPSS